MTIVYDLSTQLLSRSRNHVPMQWEGVYEFEEDACWNCGGEFLVEKRGAMGQMEKKRCPVCEATGVIQTTVAAVPLEPDWTEFPTSYNIVYINGSVNLWSI